MTYNKIIMKKLMQWVLAAILILSGIVLTSCSNSDIPSTPSQQGMEESLVGLWYEDFDYEDVTEDGKPFNRALIAVETKADHTGYVALAVFDDEFNEPLEIYGGPKDAPFTWQVTADGHVILTDPNTGESVSSARTRGDGSHSDFVDIGQINMNCTSGRIDFSNASHTGTLAKAGGNKNGLIKDWIGRAHV